MSESPTPDPQKTAPEARFFAAVSPDEDYAYPVMTPGALAVLDPDIEEAAAVAILAGLVHP